MASMTSLFRTAPLFIAIGGTAELCFLAWLLIKAVNAPAPDRQAPAIATVAHHVSRPWWRRLLSAFDVVARESPLPGKCAGE
jgi:hypothetical protein